MKQESKRHHYIPQFILRNFQDENSQVSYWDIENSKLEKRNTRSVFMNMNMYRDEINHQDNPTSIESTLAVFEQEIAELIKGKFLTSNEVVITREELEKLRIFLSLLSFRSNSRMEQYRNSNFSASTRKILENYSPEGFEDLWKREVEELAKCRSYADVQSNEVVDPIIKTDFFNDLKGMYMTLVDARGGEFLLTDIYPTLEIFPVQPGINLHMHCFYPLSPTRMLILNHVMFKEETSDPLLNAMKASSKISGNMIIPPTSKRKMATAFLPSDTYTYTVRKIYQDDVEYINALFLNEARVGVMFRDEERIAVSIYAFNRRGDIKQTYNLLEDELFEEESE